MHPYSWALISPDAAPFALRLEQNQLIRRSTNSHFIAGASGLVAGGYYLLSHDCTQLLGAKTCFGNEDRWGLEPLGVIWINLDVSGLDTFHGVSPLTAWIPVAKKRVESGVKILLDVAKESADWFPPLKSALGGVNAHIKHYEVSI